MNSVSLQIKGLLDGHLGFGSTHKNDEVSYSCPFCHHYKKKLQVNLTNYVDSLFLLSSIELGKQLAKTKNPRFYVFNPLSWTRNDIADIAYEGDFPVKVIDVSSNEEVEKDFYSIIKSFHQVKI
jgi:hypothetical protein